MAGSHIASHSPNISAGIHLIHGCHQPQRHLLHIACHVSSMHTGLQHPCECHARNTYLPALTTIDACLYANVYTPMVTYCLLSAPSSAGERDQ